jgi:hypothetical protein
MQKKLVFAILLILSLILSTTAFAQDVIDVGATVEGTAEQAEWELFLEAGQIVQIDLKSGKFDTILQLYDGDGLMLESNDDINFPTDTNSRIIFTATDSGIYTVSIKSFGNEVPAGEYTLTVTRLEVTDRLSAGELMYGSEELLEPNGAAIIEFTFVGQTGDVVNIGAVSQLDEDTSIILYDPNNKEVASADDSRSGVNPYIIRFRLAADGEYRIEVKGFDGQALFVPITVSLIQTAELLLNESAQTVALGGQQDQDVMVLDTEAGQAYLVNINLSEETASSLFFDIQESDEGFAGTRLSISGSKSLSLLFVARETGQARFILNFFSFDGKDVDFTVAVETVAN